MIKMILFDFNKELKRLEKEKRPKTKQDVIANVKSNMKNNPEILAILLLDFLIAGSAFSMIWINSPYILLFVILLIIVMLGVLYGSDFVKKEKHLTRKHEEIEHNASILQTILVERNIAPSRENFSLLYQRIREMNEKHPLNWMTIHPIAATLISIVMTIASSFSGAYDDTNQKFLVFLAALLIDFLIIGVLLWFVSVGNSIKLSGRKLDFEDALLYLCLSEIEQEKSCNACNIDTKNRLLQRRKCIRPRE